MKVDVADVFRLKRELDKINSIDLSEIVFYENFEEVKIDPKLLSEWEFIGLNNVEFITSGFYKNGLPIRKRNPYDK